MKQLNWYQIFGKSNIPDGRTVLPTDDIQILLHCANIWDKAYTTLAELLADTDTLLAVISSNNAIDYLVRSTTWAAAITVPIMTSATTPSGEVSASEYYTGEDPYHVFNGDASSAWTIGSPTRAGWIGYHFTSPVNVVKFTMQNRDQNTYYICSPKTFTFEGSNDGVTYTTLGSYTNTNNTRAYIGTYNVSNTSAYEYYRVNITDVNQAEGGVSIGELQFYSTSITDSADAMSYIGLNNYASNTLLADATWRTAICNSEYFESVLNAKVPAMTDETHPYGETFCTNFYSTGANEHRSWKAFDGTMSADTYDSWASTTTNSGVGYHFVNDVSVCMLQLQCPANVNNNEIKDFKIQYSEDGVTWNDASDTLTFMTAQPSTAQSKKYVTNTYTRKGYWRILALTSYGNQSIIRVNLAQFYGREDV